MCLAYVYTEHTFPSNGEAYKIIYKDSYGWILPFRDTGEERAVWSEQEQGYVTRNAYDRWYDASKTSCPQLQTDCSRSVLLSRVPYPAGFHMFVSRDAALAYVAIRPLLEDCRVVRVRYAGLLVAGAEAIGTCLGYADTLVARRLFVSGFEKGHTCA